MYKTNKSPPKKQPDAIHFTKPNEVTAFSAVILTFLAFSDLISTSLPTRSALEYWTTTTPLRLFFLFILTAWIYLTSTSPDEAILKTFKASTTGTSSPFDLLKNSLVFAFGFIEVCSWMWVFTLLREARKEFLVEEAKQKQLKEEMEKESEMFGFGRANRRED